MVFRWSLMELAGVAGIVGMIGSGISLVLVTNARNKVRKQPYYQMAIKTLKQNKAAIDLIGEPFYPKKVDLSDYNNNCFEALSTRLKVPFKGHKKSGHLFVWADRQDVDNDWILRRLEIIFSDISDKKVIVYKNESNEQID